MPNGHRVQKLLQSVSAATGQTVGNVETLLNALQLPRRIHNLPKNTKALKLGYHHYFDLAVYLAEKNAATGISAAMLQEQLNIGKARAREIMNEMAEAGFVAPGKGAQPRAVDLKKIQADEAKRAKYSAAAQARIEARRNRAAPPAEPVRSSAPAMSVIALNHPEFLAAHTAANARTVWPYRARPRNIFAPGRPGSFAVRHPDLARELNLPIRHQAAPHATTGWQEAARQVSRSRRSARQWVIGAAAAIAGLLVTPSHDAPSRNIRATTNDTAPKAMAALLAPLPPPDYVVTVTLPLVPAVKYAVNRDLPALRPASLNAVLPAIDLSAGNPWRGVCRTGLTDSPNLIAASYGLGNGAFAGTLIKFVHSETTGPIKSLISKVAGAFLRDIGDTVSAGAAGFLTDAQVGARMGELLPDFDKAKLEVASYCVTLNDNPPAPEQGAKAELPAKGAFKLPREATPAQLKEMAKAKPAPDRRSLAEVVSDANRYGPDRRYCKEFDCTGYPEIRL